jgi:4-alpha-glucanotransferase
LSQQEHWLEDYALFRALKEKFHGVSYLDWPAELVQRISAAMRATVSELQTF